MHAEHFRVNAALDKMTDAVARVLFYQQYGHLKIAAMKNRLYGGIA